MIRNFFKSERGANVIEYAIILGFVVVIAVVALTLIGMNTAANVDDPDLTRAFQ